MGTIIDLTNKKFNKLTVIRRVKNRKKQTRWLCKCDCGNEKEVFSGHLKQGETISCGCARRSSGLSGFNNLFLYYKHSAKKRNLEFLLSKAEFKELITKNCIYCNSEPKPFNPYSRNRIKLKSITQDGFDRSWINVNGIDRIDNNKGYHITNCAPCCKNCNTMKMALSKEDFINHLKKIIIHLNIEVKVGRSK